MYKGILYIAVITVLSILFLDKVISQDEVVSDETGKTNRKLKTIILDAGHGGKDPGAIGVDGTYEKDINLAVTLKLRDLLIKEYDDIDVVLTRDSDVFIELHDRGKIANANGGNLFVSLHSNSKKVDDYEEKTGFEVYLLDLVRKDKATELTMSENRFLGNGEEISTDKYLLASIMESANLKTSHRFAEILKNETVKATSLKSNGVKQDAFIVLYGASMPAVLFEMGFLTNQKDVNYLKSERGQNEIANALYKSIRYFKFDYDYENSL